MNCSISGEVPEDPVVSRNSGILFDRRLIDRHISEYGKCPVTGEELAMDYLIPVKAGKIVRPRPMQAASIPGMLNIFQNEWDTLMLSHFSLEKQLHTAREELSHALYQACVTQFTGHKGPITAMSFSENGYYLATAAHDGVRLWDLRKLKNFRVFSPYSEDTPTNSEFIRLGIWECTKILPDLSGTGKITCAKFGPDAKYLAVGSMDRNLRIFGPPEDNDAPMES